ncbi:MAG: hypothetical protein M1510_05225 [Nitrospirae bacterium]|nr:hypothetical protein [Nitrospirota bacterium]
MKGRTPEAVVTPADGFEEVEAIAVINVSRKAEIQVVIAGLPAGPAPCSEFYERPQPCAFPPSFFKTARASFLM